jgi:hypothetical protein
VVEGHTKVISMQPFDRAWLLLKQMRPTLHHQMGLQNLNDKQKRDMRAFQVQQFADGFSTSHQPPPEERDKALHDYRNQQFREFMDARHLRPVPPTPHPLEPQPQPQNMYRGEEE